MEPVSVVPIVCGRIGNAMFRHLAYVCLQKQYGEQLKLHIDLEYHQTTRNRNAKKVDELIFIQAITTSPQVSQLITQRVKQLVLPKFYQCQVIVPFKRAIFDYIRRHPLDPMYFEPKHPNNFIYAIDMMESKNPVRQYDTVLHVRLEDFVENGLYMPVEVVIRCLDSVVQWNDAQNQTHAIVVKSPTTNFERTYLQKITQWYDSRGFKVIQESNDPMTDYHIMREASVLICSMSTLSWMAAFFSTRTKACYFPDYPISLAGQSFKRPTANTILYPITVPPKPSASAP